MTESDQAWLDLRGNGTRARATTLSIKQTTKADLRLIRADVADDFPDIGRPKTRGDCADGPRPCPWVACRYHLYVDVRPNGSLRLPFPEQEPWDLPETCALDVAERGGLTLEQAGYRTNLTRERVRQCEEKTFATLRASGIEKLLPPDGRYAGDDAPGTWEDTLPGGRRGGADDEADEKTEAVEPEEAPPPKKEEEPMGEMEKLAKEHAELTEEFVDVAKRRDDVAQKIRVLLDGPAVLATIPDDAPEPDPREVAKSRACGRAKAVTPRGRGKGRPEGVAARVLSLLKEYERLTGVELATKAKVSKFMIARAVVELRKAGHDVKSHRGKGYWIDG